MTFEEAKRIMDAMSLVVCQLTIPNEDSEKGWAEYTDFVNETTKICFQRFCEINKITEIEVKK
jgi:hypothetical protein